jgi:kinesin family protein C2/C3
VTFPGAGEVKVFNEKNREKSWEFDEVFDTDSKQQDVYNDVSALVTSVMDGFNVCIFAYGQTGSGKVSSFDLSLLMMNLNDRDWPDLDDEWPCRQPRR